MGRVMGRTARRKWPWPVDGTARPTGPWHAPARHGRHGGTEQCRHGTARWPYIQKCVHYVSKATLFQLNQ
jgi:hypothetical protein